jgi:hypothetical protein
MRDPRLDGGPYFVQSELHRVSDRFVERFKIGVHRSEGFLLGLSREKPIPTNFHRATVILNSI